MLQRKDLFEFMLQRVKFTADKEGDKLPQAFGRWFANLYFAGKNDVRITDAAGDGKVDLFVTSQLGSNVNFYILNTKFTKEYDRNSPVQFYDEITRFWQAFENKNNRHEYLTNVVRENIRHKYKRLFQLYDEGKAQLYFVTNHKVNQKQFESVKKYGIKIFHLDDLLQFVAEHIEGAMPETAPLLLSGIPNVISPQIGESEVRTSIVFARLVDFIKYMEDDPFELLFSRNIRLWMGNTEANKDIRDTFRDNPKEFAFSNNGITLICNKHTHDLGTQELKLENPRVVNGSQTLHSIRNVDHPSPQARVLVRIIEIPQESNKDIPAKLAKKKEIIHKISIRSNLQNPIKRWNLVANDDFQNELARYFWSMGLFYERRQNEWKCRKLDLQSIKLARGPEIRKLIQFVASYYFNVKKLGPAIAQGQLNSLFEEEAYSIIRETSADKVYSLYLLNKIVDKSLKRIKMKRKYIKNLCGYIDHTLFAMYCKLFNELRVSWEHPGFVQLLNDENADNKKKWDMLAKALIDIINDDFTKTKNNYWRKEHEVLTIANYFKSRKMIMNLMNLKIPKKIVQKGRQLVKIN